MNKPSYQVGIRTKKKLNKEVRSSASLPNSPTELQSTKKKALLSKKTQKKKSSAVSKRTTPGGAYAASSPHFIHIEGERWIKTINKQTQAKKVVQKRQALKKKR